MNVHLIAIVGGSGSGKTWLAERLLEEFGENAGRISLDDFYRDLAHLSEAERANVNFDDPDAIDWPLFGSCLTAIRAGEAAALPAYDFATHTRRPATSEWRPRRLVLLDGLWLLRRAELCRIYSASVFVECPERVRLERRVARDQRERGRCARSVRAQFAQQVAPMHHRFVLEQVSHADLRVESPASPARIAEISALLRKLVAPRNAA